MEWKNTDQEVPMAYLTGHWDGKNSDQIVAEDRDGVKYLAHFSEGTIDGFKFADWYDDNEYLIEKPIVRWLQIPE